jgi:[acyl-carrier-protein] S-malonyltransferase
MKHVYMFPGQGAQFPGMGKNLYEQNTAAKELFEQANDILGFRITDIMFGGTETELKQTNVTQPAIFLHSVIRFLTTPDLHPDMVAGHSLGEFSALIANKTLTFENGLRLVAQRAAAMQRACEINPSTMAAVLGMEDARVEEICAGIKEEVVVAANYNCPGQLVISGSIEGIRIACELLKEAALPYTDPTTIQQNLINQLTAPVRWTQTIQEMVANGAGAFTEVGPGNVLQGLVKKIHRDAVTDGLN